MTEMEQLNFEVSDGKLINSYRWTPETEIKAIIHIAHGMGEHAARYNWTAQQFCQAGYAVVANDHRGHGKTAAEPGDFGENGWNRMVDDLYEMIQSYSDQYPGKEKILFGHSMGSLLSQQYVTRYGNSVDRLILSGSPGFSPSTMVFLSRIIGRFEHWRLGPLEESGLLRFLIFSSANKEFESEVAEQSGFEWLSRDQTEVNKYVDDPLCGFVPYPASLAGMFDGVRDAQRKANIRRIPGDLPVYLFSGSADPVHKNKHNINRLLDAWRERGLIIEVKYYEGGRHEMLNEVNKAQVITDLLRWLN